MISYDAVIKTSEKFYPMAFWNRFSSNTDGQVEFQKSVFVNPACQVMAYHEADEVAEGDRHDNWAGPVLKATAKADFPL